MNRIAFEIGPIQVHWYGILVAIATIVSLFVVTKNTKRYGLEQDKVDTLLIKILIAVLVGARLGFVLANYKYFLANPAQIIRIDQGGLGSHGSIITVMILGYFWLKKANIPYWQMADAISPSLSIGHVFVRLGNFINGELYGPPTNLPWGVKFTTTAVPVHPSQLYEALVSIVILFFALKWSKKPRYHGYAFLRVLLAHSLARFMIDFIRQHSPLIGPFVLTQIIALILSLATLALIFYMEHKYKSNNIQQ